MNKKALIIYIGIGCALLIVPELLWLPRVPQNRPAVVTELPMARIAVSNSADIMPGGTSQKNESCIPQDTSAPPGLLLFEAIGWVESKNNDQAAGDKGCSKGRYQISRAYWRDALEHWVKKVHDPQASPLEIT